MILLTGITGKVGGASAQHLLASGKQVRAIVRNQAKAAPWAARESSSSTEIGKIPPP